MYLYASEHALMDYHLNEEKNNKAEAEPSVEVKEKDNGTNTD